MTVLEVAADIEGGLLRKSKNTRLLWPRTQDSGGDS
jgi:hypothetical protein